MSRPSAVVLTFCGITLLFATLNRQDYKYLNAHIQISPKKNASVRFVNFFMPTGNAGSQVTWCNVSAM